jgi:hypothetical protein
MPCCIKPYGFASLLILIVIKYSLYLRGHSYMTMYMTSRYIGEGVKGFEKMVKRCKYQECDNGLREVYQIS